MIHRAAQEVFLFPEKRPVDRSRKVFSRQELETEAQVAAAFRRPPRTRPYADEAPTHPYFFHRCRQVRTARFSPYRVSFALRLI